MSTLLHLPTPQEIVTYLDQFVHGQGIAKRDIAVCVYNHYLGQAHRELDGDGATDFGKNHLLILGPTGSGKTYLVSKLAKLLEVPVCFASATSLVEAGYRGQEIESVIHSLIQRANGDRDLASRGIVYIDEIDKIRRLDVGGMRDVGGEGVQHGLLTMLDGRVIDGIDTSRILFICTGAFIDLPDIVNTRMETKSDGVIGFRAPDDVPDDLPSSDRSIYEALCNVSPEDLKNYGFIPEFTGRFARLSPVAELSPSNLVEILRSARDSVLEKKRAFFGLHGVELEFTDGALRAIADQAAQLKTGARALNRIVLDTLAEIEWKLPQLAAEGASGVRIRKETVLQGVEPAITYSREGRASNRVLRDMDNHRRRALDPKAKSRRLPPRGPSLAALTAPLLPGGHGLAATRSEGFLRQLKAHHGARSKALRSFLEQVQENTDTTLADLWVSSTLCGGLEDLNRLLAFHRFRTTGNHADPAPALLRDRLLSLLSRHALQNLRIANAENQNLFEEPEMCLELEDAHW